jgi:transposase-like protein
MTEADLLRKFPTEEAAVDHFLAIRYGGSIVCSHCGQPITYRRQDRLKAFRCYHCHNSFSPFADTIFRKTHLDLRVWFHAISLFINGRKGISSLQLARQLGVSMATGWRMPQQLRKAMDDTALNTDGTVIRHTKPTGKRGRGAAKTPVVCVQERSAGSVYAKVMLPNDRGQKLTGNQLIEALKQACAEGSTIISDDFKGYNMLDKEHGNGFIHLTVNHSSGQYCTQDGIHTNGIENFWSLLKRGIIGIYHHISLKYMQRYVNEFCFRQNTRKNPATFDVLLSRCVLKQPAQEAA